MSIAKSVLTAVLCCLVFCPSFAAAQARPNFLFILVDDLSAESLSMYGNKVCRTPNLDRLAAEGIVLDDAHHMGAWRGLSVLPRGP